MVGYILKIVLIVLGSLAVLVLIVLNVLTVGSCFNIGVRFSNFGEKLLVIRYGLLRFKVLPKKEKKPAPELSEEELCLKEEEEERKAERKKRRREKWRRRWERRKMRRAVRREKKKARAAAKAKKNKKHKFSSEADWLSEPQEGRTRVVIETVFDVLPKAVKLFRFENIELEWTVRGENPAETGIAYGRAAAVFGVTYPRLMSIFNIGRHNVRVNADFANKGKSDAAVDITVLLRPIKIVGLLFSFFMAFNRNRGIYCEKTKSSHTTFKMKPNGGNKHGRKTKNDGKAENK